MGVSILWVMSMAMLPPDGLDQETWMLQSSGSMEKGFGNLASGFGDFNSCLGEVVIQLRGMTSAFPVSMLVVTSSLTQYKTGTRWLLEVSFVNPGVTLAFLPDCYNSFLIAHSLFLFFLQLMEYLCNENLY